MVNAPVLLRPLTPATDEAAPIDLIEAQQAFAIIDVQPQGSKYFFQSAILSVDPQTRIMAIDDLFPPLHLEPGTLLVITLRLTNERRVRFSTRAIDKQLRSGGIYYRVVMPHHFTYNQRRESYRFKAPESFAEFYTQEGFFCTGIIQDISLTGARIVLRQEIDFDVGAVLNRFLFEFSGHRFNCEALIKRNHRDIEGRNIIGIEFKALPRPQQRFLEKEIFQLHRSVARQYTDKRVNHLTAAAV